MIDIVKYVINNGILNYSYCEIYYVFSSFKKINNLIVQLWTMGENEKHLKIFSWDILELYKWSSSSDMVKKKSPHPFDGISSLIIDQLKVTIS